MGDSDVSVASPTAPMASGGGADGGEGAVYVSAQGVSRNSLFLLLKFAVNLKCSKDRTLLENQLGIFCVLGGVVLFFIF